MSEIKIKSDRDIELESGEGTIKINAVVQYPEEIQGLPMTFEITQACFDNLKRVAVCLRGGKIEGVVRLDGEDK